MAISEQFKSLNLNPKKMRKLCTDEVAGVKMRKKLKKHIFQFENKNHYCSFMAALLALHFKDDS
jgi:hypothetical protein